MAARASSVNLLDGGFRRIAFAQWGDPGGAPPVACDHGLTQMGRILLRWARVLWIRSMSSVLICRGAGGLTGWLIRCCVRHSTTTRIQASGAAAGTGYAPALLDPLQIENIQSLPSG
jgi:hypothetical protein